MSWSSERRRRHKYKAFLYVYQKGRCGYCLKDMDLFFSGKNSPNQATLDHIKPQSRGGKTTWSNLILSCYSCNHKKGSKTIKPKIQPLNVIHNGLTTGRMVYDCQLVKQVTECIYRANETCISYVGTTIEMECQKSSQIIVQSNLSPRSLKIPRHGLK